MCFLSIYKSALIFIVFNVNVINCLKYIENHDHKYKHLGVKTTYENSFSNVKRIDESKYHPTCRPVQINTIYRHGIRNPGNKDINKINRIFRIINKESQNFKRVSLLMTPFEISTAKKLTEGGKIELQTIALREIKRYPQLFRDPKKMIYIASSLQRAIDSARAFREANGDFYSKIHIRDDIMRFYYKCNSIKNRFRLPSDDLSFAKLQFMQFWDKNRVDKILSKIRIYLDAPALELTAC